MNSIRRTALALSITALFALPAAAQANVGGQLSSASGSLGDAIAAAKHGDVSGFKAAAKANRHAIARAGREARHAHSATKRAKLLRKVAAASDRSVDRFADLVDLVPADLQAPLVDFVGVSADMRQHFTDLLLSLAEQLPEPVRTEVINAVTQFQADGEIDALFEALASDDVLNGVKDLIQAQIEELSTHLDDLLGSLEGLTDMLPPGAADAIDHAISMIEDHLGQISDLIDQLLSGFGGGGFGFGGGGFGFLGGFGGGSFCDLLGMFPIPLPICD
jgi:hypothetical protein